MQAEKAQALARRIAALDAEGRYDAALTAFGELVALDAADDAVREAMVEAGVELAYELALTGRDRPAAEFVYSHLRALRDRFPEDDVVISGLAAAAAVLSALCTIEKDWKAAADYAVAINHLNQGAPEELSRELDLQYGRTAATFIVGLVQDEQWAQARAFTYSLRELLLADFMLTDLAEQKGAAAADDIKKLFEAMIDAFRETEPEAAARIDADIAERKGGRSTSRSGASAAASSRASTSRR
jgi:DNA-binding SARP family transcriptional activator